MAIRKLCLVGLTVGMFACGGQDANTPPPQPPVPPPAAPVATADTPPPASTADTPAAPAPSKSDKTLAAVKAYGDAMMAKDAAKLGAAYTADAVAKMPGMPDMTGKDAIQAHFTEMWASSPDSKGAPRRIWVKDGVAVIEWTSTGTNTGPSPWGKPTGKPWGINGASIVWYNDDGLVKEEHTYMDAGTMMGQLGMAPKGAPVRPIATLPAGPPEIHVSKGDATEDTNVAAAKAFNRVFEKGDVKAFLDGMSDEITYDDVSGPAPMSGKKAAQGFFEAMTKAFPNPKATETTIFGVEDFTIDEYTMDATQKAALSMGPGMTIPNTKKTVSTHTLELLQWKDGKIAKGWAYDNGLEFMSQLGLGPKPPKAAAGKPAAGKADAAKPDAKAAAKPAADKAKPSK